MGRCIIGALVSSAHVRRFQVNNVSIDITRNDQFIILYSCFKNGMSVNECWRHLKTTVGDEYCLSKKSIAARLLEFKTADASVIEKAKAPKAAPMTKAALERSAEVVRHLIKQDNTISARQISKQLAIPYATVLVILKNHLNFIWSKSGWTSALIKKRKGKYAEAIELLESSERRAILFEAEALLSHQRSFETRRV